MTGFVRQAYMVLSPRSLDYARAAIASLLANSNEDVNLHLITDSAEDKARLEDAVDALGTPRNHRWSVTAEAELDDRAAVTFAGMPHLQAFRKGHPCWRKVTDPLLLSGAGEELVLLDPDLYFPNRFCFEPTPEEGLLLMWQQPNCLLPPEVVRRAMSAGIPLARHVDIGVSHWRAAAENLPWIDWMLGRLGAPNLPRMMHVEAIVWAAIAMREGGGYLDPSLWVCWHRTQAKRVRRKLGTPGEALLASEPWESMKCFHAGGEAKWWVSGYRDTHPELEARSEGASATQTAGAIQPFVELTPARYRFEQGLKSAVRGLGYYRLFGAKA